MGGSSKLDKLKAMQKEGKKGIVVDKTFGLKNKNKSKTYSVFSAAPQGASLPLCDLVTEAGGKYR